MKMRRSNGEGTVYYNNRRSRYEGQYRYLDPLTKKNKRAFFSSKESAKAVTAKIKALRQQLEQGVTHLGTKMTVAQWLEYWINSYKKPEIRLKTYERYKVSIDDHIVPYIGEISLANLDTELLQRHFLYLSNKGGEDCTGLAARTVNTVRRLLIQSLNDAVDLGYIGRNCAGKTKPVKVQRVDFQVLTHEEAQRLIQAAKGYTMSAWAIVLIALGTGMRLAEIFGLSWDCVDLEGKKITVIKSAVKTNHGTLLQNDLKTMSSRRVIPLPQKVVEALLEYKAYQSQYAAVHGKTYKDRGYLFTNFRGDIMHPASFSYHVFKKILLVNAGISNKVRFHDLRHTHATWLLEAGVNVKVVSERLGHANIRITLDTYAHVLKTMQAEAVSALDDVFAEKQPESKQ